MIKGIGIDIVKIQRIEKACKQEKFVKRFLNDNEKFENPAHAAGVWACKEAVLKALGTGLGPLSFSDITVDKDGQGKPFVHLSAQGKRRMQDLDGKTMWVSITHEKEYAVAQAILEG